MLDKSDKTSYLYATGMKKSGTDHDQIMQRVRVGMTGLASVALLIALASAIFSSVSEEAPVDADGAPKSEVVANLTANQAATEPTNEPLAELGVAPGAAQTPDNAAAPVAGDGR